jgi:hypothetical protein
MNINSNTLSLIKHLFGAAYAFPNKYKPEQKMFQFQFIALVCQAALESCSNITSKSHFGQVDETASGDFCLVILWQRPPVHYAQITFPRFISLANS